MKQFNLSILPDRFGAEEKMTDLLMKGSIVAGLLAAGLAVYAANIEIRDQIDSFMGDMHRQGTWASYAALVAAIGVLLQAAHYFWPR